MPFTLLVIQSGGDRRVPLRSRLPRPKFLALPAFGPPPAVAPSAECPMMQAGELERVEILPLKPQFPRCRNARFGNVAIAPQSPSACPQSPVKLAKTIRTAGSGA